MKFTIDESYICGIITRREWSMYDGKPVDKLTPDDMIRILKGEDRCSVTGSDDHPEFAQLRNTLEQQGYIKTVRNCWNGDTVLKPFYLNGWRFKKNHRFPCAAALKNSIVCARKYGWKSISSL